MSDTALPLSYRELEMVISALYVITPDKSLREMRSRLIQRAQDLRSPEFECRRAWNAAARAHRIEERERERERRDHLPQVPLGPPRRDPLEYEEEEAGTGGGDDGG